MRLPGGRLARTETFNPHDADPNPVHIKDEETSVYGCLLFVNRVLAIFLLWQILVA
ncbi:MAG: hypothetical protein RL011_1056 [Pseudomonadota bacterium]|jgi:hypothetical protein